MKNLLIGLILLISASHSFSQQVTNSYELIESYTVQDIENMLSGIPGASLFITPEYGVDFYRVKYDTEYLGGFTEVSGALIVPQNMDCKPALFSYQHGTTSSKLDVPSYGSSELDICLFFASEGNVVIAPDHIGLGASEVDIHPYIHGFSEAHTTINLMRATREIITDDQDIDVELSNQIFLFGYSQGGFTTAIAARYIEEEYADEFDITAIAPMSGPYNLAGVQTDFVNSGEAYATPGYLPYIILGHQSVNPAIFDDPSDVFVYPYDTLMPYLFTGHNYSMGYINSQATPIPTDMIHPEVVQQIEDEDHPFYDALVENDLLDWVPKTRVNLYYCTADEQVTYENAIVAEEEWSNTSDQKIEAIDLGEYNHSDCVLFALINGRNFFNSLNNNGIDFTVSYNENLDQFEIEFPFGNENDFEIEWSNGATTPILGDIDPDIVYTATVTDINSGCSHSESISVNPFATTKEFDNIAYSMYPNPTSDFVHLAFPSYGEYQITLFDASGKVVFQKEAIQATDVSLNVSTLNSGTYIVEVREGKSMRKKRLVIK